MGGGSTDSNSSSRPLTPEERTAQFKSGLANIAATAPQYFNSSVGADGNTNYTLNTPNYAAPTAQLLNNGDYQALQDSLTAGYTAPLDRQKMLDTKASNQGAADRGIWSSGLSLRANNDVAERYAPQYAKAGADATNARYALQQGDNTQANALNMENSLRNYNSDWAGANYVKDFYNGTGGTISNGSSSGWNFSI